MSLVLLKIRSAQENERGPLYMEPVIAALHSLKGFESRVGLEIGIGRDRKIALFVRAEENVTGLIES
ncbi:MAG: hypothetical protein PHE68_04490, partial [Candidatus Peribacteraceae bacterium]|nr:hypothetical protein [Candidatus Peribacteraceae bacterium]